MLDPHAARETDSSSIVKIGLDLVYGRLRQDKDIIKIKRKLAEERLTALIKTLLHMTVLHRFYISGNDRAVDERKKKNNIIGKKK